MITVILFMVVTEYLDILEIPREIRRLSSIATESECAKKESDIKALAKDHFRRLSKKCHPDHGGDATEFRILKHAYDTIKKAKLVRLSDNYNVIGISIFSGVLRNGWHWVINE